MAPKQVRASRRIAYRLQQAERAVREAAALLPDAVQPADSTPLYRYEPLNTPSFSPLLTSQRGDLVVIAPAYANDANIFLRAVNSMISFLTFQRIRLFEHKDSWEKSRLSDE